MISIRRTGGILAAAIAFAGGALAMAAGPTAAADTQAFPRAGVILSSKLSVRAAPSAKSRVVKVLKQFRSDFRPTAVVAVAEAKDAAGGTWLKLSLAMRPNGRYGWVRAGLVDVQPITKKIVISRNARTLTLFDSDKVLLRARVAIGKPGAETPLGFFYIQAAFKATKPILGAYAFETSAYSKLSEWPGGGVVGIHGTPMPQLLGKAVSHGCVRVSNAVALMLKRLAPVGTPIRIVR